MWVQGYEFQTANEFPSYWSICAGGVAGAIRRLCQRWLFVSVIRADTELSYCSSLHLLPLDEWQRAAQIHRKLMSTLSCHHCESALVFRGYSSLIYSDFSMLNCGTWLYSLQGLSRELFFCVCVCLFLFGLLMQLCKSVPCERPHLARQEVWFPSFKYSRSNLCVLAGLLGCGVKLRRVMPGASQSMQSTVGFSRVLKESMEWQS